MEDKNELEVKSDNKITAEDKTKAILDDLIDTDDVEESKRLLSLFNLNIAKKSAIRRSKLEDLLDKINDQAIERFNQRPDEVSNKDLTTYMNVVQNQMEKSENSIRSITEAPAIQINNQSVNVKVESGTPELSKESREKVLKAVEQLLKAAQDEADIVDVEVNETGERHE